ncbi:MAG: hypothetical protein HY315_10415, partial [Acidobacteria bacterium]|nr:hypothetical protein [Acidobacteriota bacterium]
MISNTRFRLLAMVLTAILLVGDGCTRNAPALTSAHARQFIDHANQVMLK